LRDEHGQEQKPLTNNSFKTVTFKNSAALMTEMVKVFVEETDFIHDAPGLAPALAFQPISKNIIKHMSKNGGNSFGITADRGPLMSEYNPTQKHFQILTLL
jgi:hypothetical protein